MENPFNEQVTKWSTLCETLTDIQAMLSEFGSKHFPNGYFKPATLEEFTLGMTAFRVSAWPIVFHLTERLEEAKAICGVAARNSELRPLVAMIEREVIKPFDVDDEDGDALLAAWQMVMNSSRNQYPRRFRDPYYNPQGGFLRTIEGILYDTANAVRRSLVFWYQLTGQSVSQSSSDLRQRITQALNTAIKAVLPKASPNPQDSLAELLGHDELDTLEVLSAVEVSLTGTSGFKQWNDELETKAELRGTEMTSISRQESVEAMRGTWGIDIQLASQLAMMSLNQLITWIELKMTGQ